MRMISTAESMLRWIEIVRTSAGRPLLLLEAPLWGRGDRRSRQAQPKSRPYP